MGRKANLKASLSIFQEKQRQAQIQKTKDAAKKERLRKKDHSNSPKHQRSAKSKGKRPATIPFTATDTILLVGEGNFSFTKALFTSGHGILAHLPPSNVTATAYDSEDTCYEKYPDARQIVQELKQRGVIVLFNVDATKLNTHKELKKRKWKRIVWNFPHAGLICILRYYEVPSN
jgi:25S rRNA (uracil2634-N3)-methyltransferase